MKSSKRRYFTQADKNVMWDRWQKGESLNSIARLLGTSHSAIAGVLSKTGGIRPADLARNLTSGSSPIRLRPRANGIGIMPI
jgi:hypothetical protein